MVVKEYRLFGRRTKSVRFAGKRLQPGKWYILTFYEKGDCTKTVKPIRRKMRLIALYKYHAQFENEKGIRSSYQYWDLERLLKGEPR